VHEAVAPGNRRQMGPGRPAFASGPPCVGPANHGDRLNYRDHAHRQISRHRIVPRFHPVLDRHHRAVRGSRSSAREQCSRSRSGVGHRHRRRARNIAEPTPCIRVRLTIINDVTAPRLQKERPPVGAQQELRHVLSHGTVHCLLPDESTARRNASIAMYVNGKSASGPIPINSSLGVSGIVSFLSQAFTLEPGDVIATGTPSGVGAYRQPPVFLNRGTVMEACLTASDSSQPGGSRSLPNGPGGP